MTPRCCNSRGHGTKEQSLLMRIEQYSPSLTAAGNGDNRGGNIAALPVVSGVLRSVEEPGTTVARSGTELHGAAESPVSRVAVGVSAASDGAERHPLTTRFERNGGTAVATPSRATVMPPLELVGIRNGKPTFRPVTSTPVLLPLYSVQWLDDRPRDACGRRRSQATMASFRKGKRPNNAGKTYAPTPPSPEQVLAILEQGSRTAPADIRNRSLFGLVWRSGLRISEALALELADLSQEHNSVLVRCGKGGKRRISGIDDYGFELLDPWLEIRPRFPFGPLFCVVEGPTKGGPVNASTARAKLHEWARAAGVERVIGDEVMGRVAPHQLRHAHACDLAREGVPVQHVSRQLGHANLAITTTYLQGIAPVETLSVIAARPRPGLAS